MNLPDMDWYSLPQLAERWEKDVGYVKHFLLTGKLKTFVRIEPHEREYYLSPAPDMAVMPSDFLFEVINTHDLFWGEVEVEKDSDNPCLSITTIPDDCNCAIMPGAELVSGNSLFKAKTSIQRDYNSLFVTLSGIKEFENIDEKATPPATGPISSSDNAPYLDTTSPFYSVKLAAAVSAWQAIYGTGTPTFKQGHKKAIFKWLKEHRSEFGGLSNQAIDQIATIVNANPRGGAPITDDEYIWPDEGKPTHLKNSVK